MPVTPTDSYPAAGFSEATFRSTYLGQRPVILGGAKPSANETTRAMLLRHCVNMSIPVRYRKGRGEELGIEWASLHSASNMQLGDLVDAWDAGKTNLYGFEGCLSCDCPELLSELDFRIAPIFNRAAEWAHADSVGWPSLLMGAAGSGSGVHIDRYGWPFWLQVVGGRKHVRIVTDSDVRTVAPGAWTPHLAQNYGPDFQLHFGRGLFDEATVSALVGRGATVWEAEMRDGDLLYIPQYAAHAAENAEETYAISSNFIDPAHAQLLHQHHEAGRKECDAEGMACQEDRALVVSEWHDLNL